MDVITLDIETFYSKEYSLSKITTEAYVNDSRFEVIGIGVKVNGAPTECFTGTMEDTGRWLKQFDWANSMAIMHNALFDAAILEWRFGIRPKVVLCTLCMGRALHGAEVGNSLDKLTQYYGVGTKGTEVLQALGKRRLDFTQAEIDQYMSYCANDVELTYALFNKVFRFFKMSELKLIDMTIKMFTMPSLMLDIDALEAHKESVITKKEKLLAACAADKATLMSNDRFAEILRSLGVEPPVKISPSTGKETYAFAKTDEEFKELLEHDSFAVQALVAARLGTKTTIEETRTERFIGIATRPNRSAMLPVPLSYYGARTGRWSACDGINMQNIPRDSKLKQAIVAPDGFVIVGADLSNIELRVGLWYAGQMDKLDLLAKGLDLYKDFASAVFLTPYDDITKEQRFIGKTAQLSLIYGTGATKLRNQIKIMGKVDIGEEEAKRIVGLYRQTYPNVVQAWAQGDNVLRAVYEKQHTTMGFNNLVQVHGDKGALLPSGLYMRYPDLQLHTNGAGKKEWSVLKRKNQRDKLYGSKVFQGHTQALARCVLTESMVRIHKRYPIALSIHDAIYCVVPDGEGNTALDFIIKELTVPPAWLPGIVLAAEGGWGKTLKDT